MAMGIEDFLPAMREKTLANVLNLGNFGLFARQRSAILFIGGYIYCGVFRGVEE